jgi:phage terminase small subunit
MEPSPAGELFVAAVTELASHGAIQQRLNRAWTSALANVAVSDLPEAVRPRVEELTAKLGGNPITRAMLTDDESARIAQEIVAVAFELSRGS